MLNDPVWIQTARKYVGEKEIPGPRHNPHIVRFWQAIGAPYRDDETAWCGAFVGGVLAESGLPVVKNAASARSFLNMPVKLGLPAYGAVVVFWRGSPTGWQGHVGFVVGRDAKANLMVLGGNQKDMVRIDPFDTDRVLGYRWPSIWPFSDRFNLPLLDSDGKVSTNEA